MQVNSFAFHWLKYQEHNFPFNIHMEICKEKQGKKKLVVIKSFLFFAQQNFYADSSYALD